MGLSRLIAAKFLVRSYDQRAEDTCGPQERAKLRIAMERLICRMFEETKREEPQDQKASSGTMNSHANMA